MFPPSSISTIHSRTFGRSANPARPVAAALPPVRHPDPAEDRSHPFDCCSIGIAGPMMMATTPRAARAVACSLVADRRLGVCWQHAGIYTVHGRYFYRHRESIRTTPM
jgi:hypothetical protein